MWCDVMWYDVTVRCWKANCVPDSKVARQRCVFNSDVLLESCLNLSWMSRDKELYAQSPEASSTVYRVWKFQTFNSRDAADEKRSQLLIYDWKLSPRPNVRCLRKSISQNTPDKLKNFRIIVIDSSFTFKSEANNTWHFARIRLFNIFYWCVRACQKNGASTFSRFDPIAKRWYSKSWTLKLKVKDIRMWLMFNCLTLQTLCSDVSSCWNVFWPLTLNMTTKVNE